MPRHPRAAATIVTPQRQPHFARPMHGTESTGIIEKLARDRVAPWLVLALAALVCFTNLGGARLWDEDEPRNAACAAEMLARGDWVVPTFNENLRTAKPVLLYWLQMLAYSAGGVNEFTARLPSAILGCGTCLLTWWLGRGLLGRAAGLLAGMILATSLSFDLSARAATPDGTLLFGVTLTLTLFVSALGGMSPAGFSGATPQNLTWRWMSLIYAAMAWSFLGKGPVGVVLPLAILGLHLLIEKLISVVPRDLSGWSWWKQAWPLTPRQLVASILDLRLWLGVLVIGLIAGPWYLWVGLRTEGEWTRQFFLYENVQRFQEPLERHGGPIYLYFWFYPAALLVGFFPWSIFLPYALWHSLKHSPPALQPPKFPPATAQRSAHLAASIPVPVFTHHAASRRFLWCWLGVWLGAFTLASTKLPSYVLPAYPALAIVISACLVDWLGHAATIPRWLMRCGWICLGLVGMGLAIALPVIAGQYFPDEACLGLIGVWPMLAAACAWQLHHWRKIPLVIGTLGLTAVAFSLSLFAWGAPRISQYQTSPQLLAALANSMTDKPLPPLTMENDSPREPRQQPLPGKSARSIGSFYYPSSNLVYYAGRKILSCPAPKAAAELLSSDPAAVIITPYDQYVTQLQPVLPPDVQILSRHRQFLKPGEIVVLGRALTGLSTAVREASQTQRK
ncbi:MAG: glycosyltransferase family 39 protein [Pirellulales bacterium]|nr:glycosyltransferase family 39 protein [Pirellulales bacterium]